MTAKLRTAVTGLLSLACVEEQALLAAAVAGPGSGAARPDYRGGSPDSWAAVPLVAHNNEFKSQQAERIVALRSGRVPPAFGEVDHASPELYRRYSAQSADEVMVGCRRVTTELIDGTWALPDEDLLDPARHPWLNGRLLWLQVVVRGFWHPTGHLGDYYLGHGQPSARSRCRRTPWPRRATWTRPRPRSAWPDTAWRAPRPAPDGRTRRPGLWPRPSGPTRSCARTPAVIPTSPRCAKPGCAEPRAARRLPLAGTLDQ